MPFMKCCDMKGFLSYIILWMLGKKSMNGAELSKELERRRGARPSPGTLYPALKELRRKGLISAGEKKAYSLTKEGRKELKDACGLFCAMFYDMRDMFRCCPISRKHEGRATR
jgi:DNA-binding PadR family transcriptional regulator